MLISPDVTFLISNAVKTSYLTPSVKLNVFSLSVCYICLKFLDSVVDYTAYGNSIPFTYFTKPCYCIICLNIA